jgi:recombination protein RecA
MDGTGAPPVPALPTGFASLDQALGIGGLPRGRIVELFGPANCGKSALALQTAAHLQRIGSSAVWIDAEHTFDAGFAASLGIDLAALPVVVPQSAEEALEIAGQFAASRAVDLVVVDSAAALVPALELETGLDVARLQTRVLATALRRIARTALRSGACMLFVNQARNRMDGSGETSAGGAPLKLHAFVRITLAKRPGSVRFRLLKNKAGSAFGRGSLEWRPGAGFIDPTA